ncbi:MAG: family 20 glycosylhydrolase [Clostridium sp.]|nr:family 20 glycosylhydrolase [Clostridium sp.]
MAIPTGRDAQLWKVEGSAASGYMFVSRSGQRLYIDPATYSTNFRTSAHPGKGMRFNLTPYGNGFEIIPTGATSLSLNPWGGNSVGALLALYYKNDPNAVVRFIPEAELSSTSVVNIIPYPASVTAGDGRFDLKDLSAIVYCNDETQGLAAKLAADLKTVAGVSPEVTAETTHAPALRLSVDGTLGAEAYTLQITSEGIAVSASAYGGFFYALQSLRQLMPAAVWGTEAAPDADWTVPCVDIADEPMLGYRGFHFDVARHFFDKEEVKKLLDVAAIYKLNRLHWHLTDDQGWRVEIPEYPRLTTVGAVRSRSLTINDPTGGVEFYDDTEYGRGCFYTLDDLREIVAYAKERNIEVYPEIDMPGHMVAAIAAYPEFSCDPSRTYEVRVTKGVSTEILNIGDDRVIDFLKCVLDHMCEVFPYEFIHLGGDECPTGAWTTNADCQRRIKEEGLTGVEELQPWLLETLGTYIHDKYGKEIVAWNELQEHWRSDYKLNPIMMAWICTPAASAAKGFRSIAVPTSPMYLDLLQASASQMEFDAPYMGGYGDNVVNSIERVYAYNPLGSLSDDQKHMCIGTQANLWTESCTSNEEAEYCYYPRLLALSETAWLPASQKNYAAFYRRLQSHADILQAKHVRYAGYAFEPKDMTAAETAMAEGGALLSASQPGAVGYPSASAYNALQTALRDLTSNPGSEEALAGLKEQIQAYKVAPLTQPEAGKYYQIVSASTYYKNRYNGSTVYEKSGKLCFHYTPQLEPEEIWAFVPQDGGSFLLRQAISGRYADMPAYNAAVVLSDAPGCAFRIESPVTSAGGDFLPGVVMLSDAKAVAGDAQVKRLYGTMAGVVTAFDNASIGHPATWRIVEVTDFRLFLQRLVEKCDRLLATVQVGEYGEPSQEAVDFLRQQVADPAREALNGEVNQEVYDQYARLYQQFLDMPRASYADALREDCYYHISNAYFTAKYARAADNQVVPADLSTGDDAFCWRFKKHTDGTVSIISKSTGTAAYIDGDAVDQTVKLGRDYAWALREVTTDLGTTAVAVMDGSGAFSWYTNPNAWSYVLTKPYDWGASIWTLTPLENDPTGVGAVSADARKSSPLYDLSGRHVTQPRRGIYITQDGNKVVK